MLHAIFNGIELGYIGPRKQIYVLKYYEFIENCRSLERQLLAKSNTLVVCDFDGSKKDDRDPDSSLVTRDLLVAGVILGPEDYIL